MSYAMYMGMITGMVGGGLLAVIALLIAKRRGVAPLVGEDERTELVKVRAGNLTFWAVAGFSFVGWVTDNVLRHSKDLPVAFLSSWSIIFFASAVIYRLALLYEGWRVSDNEAAPDDKEMKKMNRALMVMGVSLLLVTSVFVSADGRIEKSVMWFLGGLELFLTFLTVVVLGQMHQRRRKVEN